MVRSPHNMPTSTSPTLVVAPSARLLSASALRARQLDLWIVAQSLTQWAAIGHAIVNQMLRSFDWNRQRPCHSLPSNVLRSLTHTCRVKFLCQLLLTNALMASAAFSEEIPHIGPELNLGWRSPNRCGPNALYVLLSMHGLKPDYKQIISALDITEKGATAADLVRIADANGLSLVPIRTTAKELAHFSMPAIAHFQPQGELGHYVVLLRVARDGSCQTLECTRGKLEVASLGDFYSKWSGILLVRKSDWELRQQVQLITWTSAGVLFGLIALSAAILRKRKATVTTSHETL